VSTPATTTTVETAAHDKPAAARKQIRGSSLLFAGRIMSQVVTLGVHVLIVRYLSATAFGALAYALAVVQMCGHVSTFGLDRAVSRFVPIYHEQREFGRMFGTIAMVIGTMLALGTAIPLGVLLMQGSIDAWWVQDSEAMAILTIAIFLVPLEAIDATIVNLFAVFASPRAIFFRRYLLAPALRLTIVGLLILMQQDVRFLAYGYVVSAVLGVVICGAILYRMIDREGLLAYCRWNSLEVPWREVLAFTLPLLSTDLLFMMMYGLDVVLLQHFSGTADVAAYRAVQPIARLNQIVFTTFTILYTPAASRLFARNNSEGINHLYWKTATWIAVLTFPVFVASFSLGQPLTVLLFGARYEGSGTILALLALGYYFNAALGFNGTTLTIYRRVWYVSALAFVTAIFNVAINLILIPRYGALGAAIGTASSLMLHNLLKQAGLLLGTGVHVLDRRYLRVYAVIVCSTAGLWAAQHFGDLPAVVSFPLAAAVCLFVVRSNRDLLDVTETFPEMMRIPFIPLLLGKSRNSHDVSK